MCAFSYSGSKRENKRERGTIYKYTVLKAKSLDQTGRGLRHLQDIEKGRKNPSYDVLASFIKRLGISANELFYPDASEQEKQVQHFMGKFLACTEDERQIILKTLDYMAEQFISRRYKSSDPQNYE